MTPKLSPQNALSGWTDKFWARVQTAHSSNLSFAASKLASSAVLTPTQF
jgi:hypothetical protein